MDINCHRCNWNVLDWNKPSIEFYKSKGGIDLTEKEGWLSFRLTRSAMEAFVKSWMIYYDIQIIWQNKDNNFLLYTCTYEHDVALVGNLDNLQSKYKKNYGRMTSIPNFYFRWVQIFKIWHFKKVSTCKYINQTFIRMVNYK